nr:hypothetical protein 9 [Bacillaceae bacterium]
MVTIEYVNKLIGKIFKILPLFEEKNEGLSQYIHSINYEIYGLQYVVEKEDIPTITSLIGILEHFYDDSLQPDPDIKVIRREVLHCIDLIEKSFGVGD